MTRFERKILRSAPPAVLGEIAAGGWSLSPTGGGHVRLVHRSGAIVFTGSTPSDKRSWQNVLADMRRARRRAA